MDIVASEVQSTSRELPCGVWRNFKNNYFLVLGYGRDCNDEDRLVVIYVPLYAGKKAQNPRIRIRTASDFFALLCANPNCATRHLTTVDPELCQDCLQPLTQRFIYQSPEWIADQYD